MAKHVTIGYSIFPYKFDESTYRQDISISEVYIVNYHV